MEKIKIHVFLRENKFMGPNQLIYKFKKKKKKKNPLMNHRLEKQFRIPNPLGWLTMRNSETC